jgi:hypothetical protein
MFSGFKFEDPYVNPIKKRKLKYTKKLMWIRDILKLNIPIKNNAGLFNQYLFPFVTHT